MKKNLSLIAVLVFVLTFGGLVFAQNTNNSNMGNMNSGGTTTGTSTGRRHRRGRRRGRRRHGRRRGRRHGRKSGGSANSNAAGGNSNR